MQEYEHEQLRLRGTPRPTGADASAEGNQQEFEGGQLHVHVSLEAGKQKIKHKSTDQNVHAEHHVIGNLVLADLYTFAEDKTRKGNTVRA